MRPTFRRGMLRQVAAASPLIASTIATCRTSGKISSSTAATSPPVNNVLTTTSRSKSYVSKYLRGQLPSDLKDVQGTIGCLFGSLPDADEYEAFILPQQFVEQYNQLGYVKLPAPIFDAQQCDKLADEVNELANNVEHHPKTELLYATSLSDLTGGPLFFCQGQWRATWGMHDFIFMPSLTVAASQLLGNSIVRLWYDEVFMKSARKGPCIPWQQNFARWQHTGPMQHVTAMIALDTLNKDRSAPCLIPGSHRWRDGDILPNVTYDPTKDESQQMNTIWEIVDEDEREILMDMPPSTIDLRRGEVMFIHPTTLYATHGNRTLDNSRFLFVHFIGGKVTAVHGGPLLPHTTKFAPGASVQGPYYPVVFDPSLTEALGAIAE